MSIFRDILEELQRKGANPWRAAPSKRLLVLKQIPPLFVAGATVIGTLGFVATVGIIANVRPAAVSDIRLAATVRSVLPNADELAPLDLRARLAMEPEEARALIPIINEANSVMDDGWLAELSGRQPLAVNPRRIHALRDFIEYLSAYAPSDRHRLLDRFVAFEHLMEDPPHQNLLEAIAQLPEGKRRRLAEAPELRKILERLADMSEQDLQFLVISGLPSIPADLDRRSILLDLPELDASTVTFLGEFLRTSADERAPLKWILERLQQHDWILGRALSAIYVGNSMLIATVERGLPKKCSFRDYEYCR